MTRPAAPGPGGPGSHEPGPAGAGAARPRQLTTVLRAVRGRTVPPAPARPTAAAPAGPAASRRAPLPAALADAVAGLDDRRRAQVLDPLGVRTGGTVRWGTAAARQVDGTTCGAAVLGVLAAAGDPALALWLVTGGLVEGHRPALLDDLGVDVPDGPVADDPAAPAWFRTPDGRGVHAAATAGEAAAARWGALQLALQRRSTAGALAGVLTWPRALGTPPWGAARQARFPGVGYRSVMVDDTRADELADLLARVDDALDHGVPVPLYSGGDLGQGIAAAVPRHVVLAAGRTRDGYRVYEPGAGAVLPVGREALLRPTGPVAALGHWTHLAWAALPVRAGGPGPR